MAINNYVRTRCKYCLSPLTPEGFCSRPCYPGSLVIHIAELEKQIEEQKKKEEESRTEQETPEQENETNP